MSGPGIDYSGGSANRDLETGIHYGVIPQGDVLQAWADRSEAIYDEEDDSEEAEPVIFAYKDDGYKAFQSPDDSDIFVELSPYYVMTAYCSPCAPGAGYINNADVEDGIKAYCFGEDWYDDDSKPEFHIYCVKHGKVVYCPDEHDDSLASKAHVRRNKCGEHCEECKYSDGYAHCWMCPAVYVNEAALANHIWEWH